MTDTQVEILTLAKLGVSTHGIHDLTGYPLRLVRETIAAARTGARGVRKCSEPPEPFDPRCCTSAMLTSTPWYYYRKQHLILHANEEMEKSGPVRVLYHRNGK